MRKLNVTSEKGATTSYELAEAVITVGRAPENLIRLEDPSVSGCHAQLQLLGETYELRDLDSTNGTRVNGRVTQAVALRAGDRIRFGKVEACFECDVPAETQPLPVLPAVEARPAEISARPVDFANASPFPRRAAQKDPVRLAVVATAAVAIVAFLAGMVAVAIMQPPAL